GGLFANSTNTQPYKYNGKELDTKKGLNWYDYGARHYDAALGRFTTIDPIAEKYYSMSPYAYCANNPVNAIDPDGKLPVFLIPLAKGAVGAIVDAAAQVTISMANGQGFGEAMSNIDYTSVGASFVTSAIAMPSMSTGKKIVTSAVVAVDAMLDINGKGETETIGAITGGDKPISKVAIDAIASFIPGKVVDNVTSGFNKAVGSDLSSSTAATLTKETKSSMKQAQSVVNSTGFQAGANAAADYIGGVVGGQTNKVTSNNSSIGISAPTRSSIVQPNDAIRIQKNIIYPLYPK
ncbi:RHS repeat-associated core domain-containing protein, partial [Bacteroides oleiciplenus]